MMIANLPKGHNCKWTSLERDNLDIVFVVRGCFFAYVVRAETMKIKKVVQVAWNEG